jgi:sugar-specific transcriptional regulator TrmB
MVAHVNEKQTERLLTALGLTRNEAAVYVYLLRHAGQTASAIGKGTGITRTNSYYVLDRLQEKGLVSKSEAGRKGVFRLEHPLSLKRYLDDRLQHLEASRSDLQSMMSQLIVDFNLAEHRPGVFRFEGREGLLRAYDELLKDRSDIISLQDHQAVEGFLGEYSQQFTAQRVRLRVSHRIITPTSEATTRNELLNDRVRRQFRYIDPLKLPFTMDLKVSSEKLVMTTFVQDSAVGIVIIDKEINKNFHALLEFVWDLLPSTVCAGSPGR